MLTDCFFQDFATENSYSAYLQPDICGQGTYLSEVQTTFPTFVGEWSLQSRYNNTLEGREAIFNTQRYAWLEYVSGGAFWTAVSYATSPVDGEGIQRDYWSYIDLIHAGVIKPITDEDFCPENSRPVPVYGYGAYGDYGSNSPYGIYGSGGRGI